MKFSDFFSLWGGNKFVAYGGKITYPPLRIRLGIITKNIDKDVKEIIPNNYGQNDTLIDYFIYLQKYYILFYWGYFLSFLPLIQT